LAHIRATGSIKPVGKERLIVSCLLVTLKLGLQDLFSHRRLVLVMSLAIAIVSGMLLILEVYRSGLADKFNELSPNLLVVHESQSLGEFYGSRLPNKLGEMLSSMGISMVIPEIYAVTGTSAQNAIMIRGIDLGQYTRLEPFNMLSGRSLRAGDPPRLAMIGWRLAKSRRIDIGEMISLRGRDFNVVGIFRNGTYMDNQAWISISDAQALLGWGQDVSVYIIPQEGILQDGNTLLDGISVTRKGESLRFSAAQFQPFIDLMSIVVFVLGVSAALALTNILWRLAWLRRRELAILRTTGFSTLSLVGYLLAQAVGITILGILLGSLFTLLFTTSVKLLVPSFTIVPRLDRLAVFLGLRWIGLMILAGSLLPAWWLSRLNLAQQLHSE
jgi:putative ABC transport system permease protein